MVTYIIVGFLSAIISLICSVKAEMKDEQFRNKYFGASICFGIVAIMCVVILL